MMDTKSNSRASPLRPRAYSYLRFSTPEQSKGDSFRRQNDMAAAYAQKAGLELDRDLTFHDLGVSGFRGQNVEAGRLADFLEAVEKGLVPQGSILLVEQLDRLSRLVPRKAIRVLERIMEAGVSVVTLNDGRLYDLSTIDSDQISFMLAILTFMRANEESETKSRRLKQSWGAKRADLANKVLTSKCPAWLRLKPDGGAFEPIPERARVVERIFALALAGVGQHTIAATFNEEGMAPWGRGDHWQRSYIAKVLSNPAVMGTLTPHIMDHESGRKRRVPQEPVLSYYPPVISAETFAEVQTLQAAHGAPSRGRHAHFPISNILAGLATCPKCAKTMTRVQKGKRSKPTFVCTAAKAGAGCTYKSVSYHQIEERLVLVLPGIIQDREGMTAVGDLERQAVNLEGTIGDRREAIETVLDELLETPSPALRARLRKQESELGAMVATLQDLRTSLGTAAGPVIGARITKALAALEGPEGEAMDRAEANRGLRSIFKRAVINWPEGTVDLEWTHGGICRVHYAYVSPEGPAAAERLNTVAEPYRHPSNSPRS